MFIDTENTEKTNSIPLLFRKPDHNLYPPSNYPDFESWLSDNIKDEEIKPGRIYLKILWTSYYKNVCNYGNDKNGIKVLQDFLGKLDTSKKYFTVIGWDDGILNDISHLDIKVFSMAGGRKDYGLPLICQPHKIKFNNARDIFCSFVGRITNPIRQEIVNIYSGKAGYFVSIIQHSLPDYCRILSRSVFGLAPAGYGTNSFRIQECIEYGCIPVWIGKEILPIHDLNFNDIGIWINSENVRHIDKILSAIPKEVIEYKQSRLQYIFDKYYTFESNKRFILDNL